MNVWLHLPTIVKWRHGLRTAGIITLCVAFITTLFLVAPANAATGVNQTISFQGRLLSSTGAVVPDGHYNIQFKIYQDGDGQQAGDVGGSGGTLKWTETYINNGGTSGVQVKNGFFSVNLGTNNPFGSQVDWNQDTLWLSMNIAGSSGSCTTFGTGTCTADGEMLPMKRINSVPYALNAGTVGGKAASDLIQNGTSSQTANFNISGSGTASTLQGNTSVLSPLFDTASAGTLSIGSTNATTISIGSATANQTIGIGSGSGNTALTLGSSSGTSSTTLQAGSGGIAISSSGGVNVTSSSGDIALKVASSGNLTIKDHNNTSIISVSDGGAISTGATSSLSVGGTASFNNGLSVTGTASATSVQSSSLDRASAGTLSIGSTNATNIKIGDNSGQPTLLTLDNASSTPTATGASLTGSMYYDTSLGIVQCYNGSTWGSCSATPVNFVTLSPEFAGAVLQGSGNGTMTAGLCSSTLNINDGTSGQPTICGTNETYNYYDWTSSQGTTQNYGIYVSYQLPSNFSSFVASSTSLKGRTDSSNAAVTYDVFRKTSTGLTQCGTSVSVSTGAQSSWQTGSAAGSADPSACSFSAGDTLVVRVNTSAKSNANAYVGTLNFAYK